jgi:predicted anti-sigma-YlaC factor YlaD
MDAQYDNQPLPPEVEAHLSACSSCEAFKHNTSALDAFLAVDEPASPRPGFDTRFYARLNELKTQQSQPTLRQLLSRARWWFAGAAVTCTAVLTLFIVQPTALHHGPFNADMPLAMELDLLEDLDLLAHLEEAEDFELLNQLQLGELQQGPSEIDKERVQ